MPPKECDPRCTGRCNKNRLPIDVAKANKGCDPRCTGRCSKKNAGTSPPSDPSPLSGGQEVPILMEMVSPLEGGRNTMGDTGGMAQGIEIGQIGYIIMDLDGVVLDIETVYEWVINDLVEKFGIPPSEAKKIVDLQDEESARKICTDYKLAISPQDFMIEFKNTSIKHLGNTPLMPGIENLTEYFISNKFLVAVASTSNDEAYNLKTNKHTEFFRKFSHIVLGGSDPEVTARKPSPQLYKVCGSRFPSEPDPKSILILEDAPEGVTAAKAAGMNVVWFPNKYMKKDEGKGAVAILNSIEEFNPEQYGLPPMK